MGVIVTVETLVLVLVCLLVAGLLRSHAEILRRLEQLSPAAQAPAHGAAPVEAPPAPPRTDATAHDLAGTTLDGDAVKLSVRHAGTDTLLAFMSSGCLTCEGFWQAFRDGRAESLPPGTRLVAVTKDSSHESPSRLRALASPDVPLVMSTAAWDAYGVPVSPYFVYVDGRSGSIQGEGTAERWDQIVSLLRDAVADAVSPTSGGRNGGSEPVPAGRGSAGRVLRADLELRAAGVAEGHPSLYVPGDPGADA